MSDDDFEAALNQLGLTSDNNYTPADGSETTAISPEDQQAALSAAQTPAEPNASMPAAGTPPADIESLLSSSNQSTPSAGTDGSPEANPNVPVPSMPSDQIPASTPPGGQSTPSPANPQPGTPAAAPTSTPNTQQSNMQSILSLINSLKTPNQTPGLGDTDIKNAQDTARLKSLITGIGEAGGNFAATAAGRNFDPSFYTEQQKLANQPVQDIETRRNAMLNNTKVVDNILSSQLAGLSLQQKQQANDPNSDISKTARGIIAMLHPGIENTQGFNNLGAEDLKDFTQHILETKAKLDAAQAQRDTANAFRQSNVDAAQARIQNQQDQQNQQMQDKISKEVNTLSQSSRNALGAAGRSLISADRASKILNQPTVTPPDLNSVSLDIANIISGSATVSGTQQQQYNTLKQQSDNLIQRLTANPQNVDAPALKQHLQDVISGMRKISSDVAQKNLAFVQASHPAFAKANPTYFEDIAKGLSDQTAAPTPATGTTPATSSQTGAYSQDVMDYAKEHNITPDQANQIKQQRTAGAQ